MTTPNERLAQEMLALADSLRQTRSQVAFLVQADDLRLASQWVEISLVLCEGLNVSKALETLAGKLAEMK